MHLEKCLFSLSTGCIYFYFLLLMFLDFVLQYVVFIVVGTGVVFMIVFHVGVKETERDCTFQFATKSSKRSASNWTAWFREPMFYQV